jgi:hypothetical protein
MIRRLFVILVALLLAIPVVRSAAVRALADRSPDAAARAWPGHPTGEIALALTEIGRSASARKPVPPSVFAAIDDAAVKAPLAAEPFLVRGVQAGLSGNTGAAIALFEQAELRNPRSLAARYFLSDAYFRTGNVSGGLNEIRALSHLAPHGIDTVAPYVALYAKNRAVWPQLRQLFRSDPNIEDAALTRLAGSAANADTILALANWNHVVPGTGWVPTLVNSLVAAGQYERARALWAKQWKVPLPPGPTIYNPGFADTRAATPFNWELVSSAIGMAEPQPGGRLHVIFYGQDSGMLARQLLVLPPGTYRVTMHVAGDPARIRSLRWSLRCDKADAPLSSITLDAAGSRPWIVAVPPSCRAQWLELSGTAEDISQQIEATIDSLKLTREGANG